MYPSAPPRGVRERGGIAIGPPAGGTGASGIGTVGVDRGREFELVATGVTSGRGKSPEDDDVTRPKFRELGAAPAPPAEAEEAPVAGAFASGPRTMPKELRAYRSPAASGSCDRAEGG
ncbi:hypothetical protein HK405_001048 [Cladochytrium tenue]|nr:hypothetical protein HK405_001048 [Cladochytrium tenue]